MTKLFLSYGEPDRKFAEKLCDSLKYYGFEVFFFPVNAPAGRKLHRVMRDGIAEADFTILICSLSSLSRRGVLNEIEECLSKEARLGGDVVLVPITIDDYVFGDWSPEYSGHAQAVRERAIADFRHAAVSEDEFDKAVRRLCGAIVKAGAEGPGIQAIRAGHELTIFDDRGRDAEIVYTKTFKVIRGDCKVLDLPDLTGTGKIEVIGCNLGRLFSALDEGGKRRLEFIPFENLIINNIYTMEVILKCTDCYTENDESVSLFFHMAYPAADIIINFPPTRIVRECSLMRIFGSERLIMHRPQIHDGGRKILSEISEPLGGAHYLLRWSW